MFSNVPDLITMPGRFLSAPDVTANHVYAGEFQKLGENMHTLEDKQKLLDNEEQLVERGELLVKRQEKLKEYEKDVEDAEALLDKRQNIAQRRSQDVELLNHELLSIKHDLKGCIDTTVNQLHGSEESNTESSSEQTANDVSSTVNSPEESCKARRHWQLARRHLIDKVTLLETMIQRYRTQVATSSATSTAKDMIIARLQKETLEMRDELEMKEKRIKQLESQLALSIEDKTRSEKKLDMLLEELQNIDLNATARVLFSPEQTPSKSDTTNKRQLLKKQRSMFSLIAHHGSDKHEHATASSGSFRRRTCSTKESKRRAQFVSSLKQNPDHDKMDKHKEWTKEGSNDEPNETAVNVLAVDANDDADSLSGSTDDLGSKACAIM